MELVDSEVLEGKAVVLDGKHFHNCRYKKCTLIYEGGEWAQTNTTFDQCTLSFTGAAGRTMAAMAQFGMLRAVPMPIQTSPAAKAPSGSLQ
jgi:hypothetical protein